MTLESLILLAKSTHSFEMGARNNREYAAGYQGIFCGRIREFVVEEISIWRAAKPMVDRYAEDAENTASMRASDAREKGDLFNADVWSRVAGAVREQNRKSADGQSVN